MGSMGQVAGSMGEKAKIHSFTQLGAWQSAYAAIMKFPIEECYALADKSVLMHKLPTGLLKAVRARNE